MSAVTTLVEFEVLQIGKYSLTIGEIIVAVLIVVFSRIILWSLRQLLFRKYSLKRYNEGNLHAFFQLVKYIVWVVAIIAILETFGLNINVLLASSAALLVGVGLGLQNTFNDLISGIILLFEGTIKVGDILEIEEDVVKIQKIGLRTSEAMNRDDIITIIPNSLITTSRVINWSHQSQKTRFRIYVSATYGSHVDLVLELLKNSAFEYSGVKDKESINARLIHFGHSSLDFELLFFSRDIFRIENVKSDIRKVISKKFAENKIVFPYNQLDVHMK